MGRVLSVIFILLLFLGCATTDAPSIANFGIQPGVESYVPARIAVAPCQPWPSLADYKERGSVALKADELQELCHSFDEYVLKGFANQPYLHGYTPKVIAEMLKKSDHPDLMSQWDEHWQPQQKCEACSNSVAFYHTEMAVKISWQQWLNDLSKFTRHCDALLLPLILTATAEQQNDRGLRKSEKELALALFLIDTNNGKLIWAQSRNSGIHNESLQGDFPPFPPWSSLSERLLTEALWKEFPGRLIY